MLKASSTAIAFITAFAFIASVIHEYAFFSVLGDNWRSLIEVNDYLVMIIVWLPSVAIVGLVGGSSPIVIDQIIRPPQISKNILKSKYIKKIMRLVKAIFLICLVLSTIILIGASGYFFLMKGWVKCAYSLSFLVGVFLLYLKHVYTDNEIEEQQHKNYSFILLICLFLAFCFFLGCKDGYKSLEKSAPSSIFSFVNNTSKSVTLLRSLNKGYLVRDNKNMRLEFYPKETVERISDIKNLEPKRYCDFFSNSIICIIEREIGPLGPPDNATCKKGKAC